MDNKYTTIIRSQNKMSDINLKELWRYKDLIGLYVKRNFKLTYKQTVLGPLWLILTPLLTSVVFTFIFGQLSGISTDGVPQFLFYMAGNTMWGLFNSGVTGTASTFTANAAVFGKIYFPRLTVPVSQVITALVNFGIQFAMLMCFFAYYYFTGASIKLSVNFLLIPLLLLQTICLALGVGIIVSSLTTKYRDLAIAIGFGMQLWMYVTPVVYPLSTTSGLMYNILILNPVTPIIHNFKYALLGTGGLLVMPWILSVVVTVLILFIGIVMFNKVEKTFMDTV